MTPTGAPSYCVLSERHGSCYSCVKRDEASKPHRVRTITGDAHPRTCCSHTTAHSCLACGDATGIHVLDKRPHVPPVNSPTLPAPARKIICDSKTLQRECVPFMSYALHVPRPYMADSGQLPPLTESVPRTLLAVLWPCASCI